MKVFAFVALIGFSSAIKDFFNNKVGEGKYVFDYDKEFPFWMDGFGGYTTYMRDIPDRFEEESDDRLMNSLYKKYATEGKDKQGLPTGVYWIDESAARAVCAEVA